MSQTGREHERTSRHAEIINTYTAEAPNIFHCNKRGSHSHTTCACSDTHSFFFPPLIANKSLGYLYLMVHFDIFVAVYLFISY